jgi:hypothetical protein
MAFPLSAQRQFFIAPIKQTGAFIRQAAFAIGHFFYGTEARTKRSITFSYLCIGVYLLSAINAEYFGSCAL